MRLLAILFVFMTGLFLSGPVLAAPNATMRTDAARKFVYITFSDLSQVARVSYTLTYDSRTGQKGFEGGFKNNSKTRTSTRRQILGTCSSSRCVYHSKVGNLQLNATFTTRGGKTTSVSRSLK